EGCGERPACARRGSWAFCEVDRRKWVAPAEPGAFPGHRSCRQPGVSRPPPSRTASLLMSEQRIFASGRATTPERQTRPTREGIRAVIFDIDGVLLDSRLANAAYYRALLETYGYPPVPDAVLAYGHSHTLRE